VKRITRKKHIKTEKNTENTQKHWKHTDQNI